MTVRWIKLTGSVAEKFNDQYSDLRANQEVTEAEFPPDMFVGFMLDIRQQALTKEVSNGGQQRPRDTENN